MGNQEDFYFFAIYAAPAEGEYNMSRAEMQSFNILESNPVIIKREESIKALFAWAEKEYATLFSPSTAILQ